MSGPADKVKSELKGTTLRVYWVLLKKGSGGTGPREVMRELGLSSPSVASYHLEKLSNLGLVEKDIGGNYVVRGEVKVEVFSDFVRVVGMMLPRYLFYSVLFTTMLVAYVLLYPLQFTPQTIMVLIFGLTGCIITWVETVRAWMRRPF
ncbi:MAG: ArsR family transcriptional regulator [Candidatus Methanomethyliaceae archaeon]|nr:ArsR family transcriptional regulator [Candidatus Methanomethyliaceae archaeon]MDD1766800.1 ArsR family transcriptional regulator [Candidatus Methanomethyliaceae archaeon]